MARRSTTAKKPAPSTTTVALSLPGFSPAGAQAFQDLMSEGATFVAERMQHDLEATLELMACKTPTDVMRVQQEYMKTAMQHYTEAAMRAYNVFSANSREMMENTGTSTARKYDDVPL
jgi:hypothetical protein